MPTSYPADIGAMLDTNEAALLLLILVPLAAALLYALLPPRIELHAYQKDFLDALGAGKGGAVGALQRIVDRAMTEPRVKAAVFDEFHCVHCGSVSPADWIKTRKGTKSGYRLRLSGPALAFLSSPLLVTVEKRGDPPKRMVTDRSAKRADASKAARCCIDWAIKNYGALADGTPKPE